MTVEEEKVWQLPPAAMCSMFPIMSFIIPNMSMKPPDIPNIPKGETAPACILRLAGLVAGMLPSVMLRKGLYPKPPDNMRLIC